MRQDIVRPGDDVKEYVDPVFNADNRHLPKMFDILGGQLTLEESERLKEFIDATVPSSVGDGSTTSSVFKLLNRPDAWDEHGIIEKLYKIARAHIMETYWMIGNLEPRDFLVLRTEDLQSYSESYGEFDANGETIYTAIVTPCMPTDYYQGETRYVVNGEGIRPNPVDMIVHRNEELNNWEITEVITGTRYDLILVFQEPTQRVSYDFEIEQSVDDGIDY